MSEQNPEAMAAEEFELRIRTDKHYHFVGDSEGTKWIFLQGAKWQKSRAQPVAAESAGEDIAAWKEGYAAGENDGGKNVRFELHEKISALEAELEEKCEALRDALKSNQEYARVIDMLKNQDTLDTKNGVPFDAADEASYQIKIAELEERLAEAERILKAVSKYGPQQGTISQSACAFCDMGGAGYASRGDGFHDDSCAVKDAQVFLAKHPSPARGEGVE